MLVGDGVGLEIVTPITIVGIGGAGAKLAARARSILGARCVLVSNDRSDLAHDGCESVFVNVKKLLNPSPNAIRGALLGSRDLLAGKLNSESTVIIIGNLAGKAGTALAPVVASMAKQSGKNVVSFVILPFKFEKDKLFHAGVALRRMRESSDCLVMVDNDALLFNNPDLSVEDCYRITNDALVEVVGAMSKGMQLGEANMLCTSRDSASDAESALKESVRMLYSDVSHEEVKRAMVYVIGGDKVPVGVLNSLVDSVHNILGKNGVEVGLSVTSASSGVKTLLLASVLEKTILDRYDPLSMLPGMDWDEIECDLSFDTTLPRMD